INGARAIERLKAAGVETHLVVSKWAARTLTHETSYSVDQVGALATEVHAPGDLGATIASGSFVTLGMLIAPCSMRTLGAIANGVGDNLIHRAADVVLKERRQLVLAVQGTPLQPVHPGNKVEV